HASHALRRNPDGSLRLSRHDRRNRERHPPERKARQGRAESLEGPSSTRPRGGDEPGRSPNGWGGRPDIRWRSPRQSLGPAFQGLPDPEEEQAFQQNDPRPAARPQGEEVTITRYREHKT